MAMTVRLPEDLDARLDELARKRHTSKHALIVEASAMLVDLESRTQRATDIAAGVRLRYADLLRRLEEA